MTSTTISTPGAVATRATGRRAYLTLAAACSLVAAATHVLVIPEHLQEWVLAAVFFGVLAVLQLGFAAVLLRRPGPRTLELGVLGTVGLVVFYVLTRTVALPFVAAHGAHQASHLPVAWGVGNGVPVYPGEGIEAVGTPDLVCLVAELALVALLLPVLPVKARRRATNLLVGLGVALLALRFVGVLG